jgi:DNA relaxase NicK
VQVCAYEKGKESKGTYLAKKFPSWIRYEVRWKAKKGILDLAMLLPENWLAAAAGTSVYLNSKMKVVGDKFTMAHEKVSQDALERAVKGLLTLRNQYGPMIYDLHSLMGSEALFHIIAREQTIGPLIGLSVYDVPEIMARIDSAPLGVLRSIAQGDESGEDYLF